MTLALPAHVHMAILGEDVVFLDVIADAYACVPGGAAPLRPSADRRRLDPVAAEAAEALRDAGLAFGANAGTVGGAEGDLPASAPPGPPTHDLPPGGPDRASPLELLRLLLAWGDYLTRYRGRSFARVLAHAETRRPAGALDPGEVFRLARLFDRLAIWLPIPGKCLARSFVLLCFLHRSGQSAAWVFGVRTWPFTAHCWLQVGPVALDDHAERVAGYEPILVL